MNQILMAAGKAFVFTTGGCAIGAAAELTRNYKLNRSYGHGVVKAATKHAGKAALDGALRGKLGGLLLL